jgi:competence ComEA-like helix-hairpin-helix protein
MFLRSRSVLWPWLAAILLLLAPTAVAKKKPPVKPVNINTAKAEELQQVPGIGPSTADKIVQMRRSYGAFKSLDDLLAIRGLGPKRLDRMRKYLSVGNLPTLPSAPKVPGAGTAPAQATPTKNCPGCAKPKNPPAKSMVVTRIAAKGGAPTSAAKHPAPPPQAATPPAKPAAPAEAEETQQP